MAPLSLKDNIPALKRLKAIKKSLKPKPPKLNSAQRYAERQARAQARYAKIKATRAMLVQKFPKCFKRGGKAKLPLAVGIDKMIFEALPDVPRIQIRKALHDYTTGASYLKALTTSAYRYRLDGSIGGEVSPDHAAKAEKELEEVLKRRKAFADRRAKRGKHV